MNQNNAMNIYYYGCHFESMENSFQITIPFRFLNQFISRRLRIKVHIQRLFLNYAMFMILFSITLTGIKCLINSFYILFFGNFWGILYLVVALPAVFFCGNVVFYLVINYFSEYIKYFFSTRNILMNDEGLFQIHYLPFFSRKTLKIFSFSGNIKIIVSLLESVGQENSDKLMLDNGKAKQKNGEKNHFLSPKDSAADSSPFVLEESWGNDIPVIGTYLPEECRFFGLYFQDPFFEKQGNAALHPPTRLALFGIKTDEDIKVLQTIKEEMNRIFFKTLQNVRSV